MATEVPIHPDKTRKENNGSPRPCRFTLANFVWFIATVIFWFLFGFITSLHSVVLYCWRKRTVHAECTDSAKVHNMMLIEACKVQMCEKLSTNFILLLKLSRYRPAVHAAHRFLYPSRRRREKPCAHYCCTPPRYGLRSWSSASGEDGVVYLAGHNSA